MPLRKHEILPLLLSACPDFQTYWQKHLELWKGDSPGIYIDVHAFVDYLMDVHRQGQQEKVRPAFEILEKFLEEGDPEVQNIAVVGLIEGIQNSALHANVKGLEPFLKEQSRIAWDRLNEFWEGLSESGSPSETH